MNVIDLDSITGTASVDSTKLEMLLTLDVAVSTQQLDLISVLDA